MFRTAALLVLAALAAPARADAPQAAALRAYRDRQTGQWLSAPVTPAHAAIAQQGLVHRDDALTRAETIPGVGVLVHLNHQLTFGSVVKRRDDGRFATSCEQGATAPTESAESAEAPAQ